MNSGLRQRKHDRVRADIMDAGMRLFVSRGFDATTVDEIAEAAEVSRRTLFRYFETKGAIVMAWTIGFTEFLVTTLRARPLGEPNLESLKQIFLALVTHATEVLPDVYAFGVMIERTPSLRYLSHQKHAEWEESLAAVLVERRGDAGDNVVRMRLIARVGVAVFRTAIDEWLATEGQADYRSVVLQMFDLLEHSDDTQAVLSIEHRRTGTA